LLNDKFKIKKEDISEEDTFEGKSDLKLTVFAPKLFKMLIKNDSIMLNPYLSLDPEKNLEQIH